MQLIRNIRGAAPRHFCSYDMHRPAGARQILAQRQASGGNGRQCILFAKIARHGHARHFCFQKIRPSRPPTRRQSVLGRYARRVIGTEILTSHASVTLRDRQRRCRARKPISHAHEEILAIFRYFLFYRHAFILPPLLAAGRDIAQWPK